MGSMELGQWFLLMLYGNSAEICVSWGFLVHPEHGLTALKLFYTFLYSNLAITHTH